MLVTHPLVYASDRLIKPATGGCQVDEEPPIRANTTILLGNLAQYLGEATQKRVLLNAFTRALKDGFPPARVAGLRVRTPPSLPPFLS